MDEDMVRLPFLAVHRDHDASVLQHVGEGEACKLSALICVVLPPGGFQREVQRLKQI